MIVTRIRVRQSKQIGPLEEKFRRKKPNVHQKRSPKTPKYVSIPEIIVCSTIHYLHKQQGSMETKQKCEEKRKSNFLYSKIAVHNSFVVFITLGTWRKEKPIPPHRRSLQAL